MAQRVLEELSPHECYALLGQARVGRLVYEDELGPVAVPVNYAMAGTDIVVRVEGGTKRLAMEQPTVAFEVDHVDEDERSGWSVIARGSGTEVEIRDVPALLRRIDGDPHVPWAVGI